MRLGADQYHHFTARLSAHGHQVVAMRVVAACILALAVPALLAAAFPRTTDVPGGRVALAVIGVGCVPLALPWLRHRWPSRTQSAAVVLIGSVALAVGCLVPADPRSGLAVAAGFPFVLGYAALFHSLRLVVVAGAVTAFTIGWLFVRTVTVTDPATAVAVTIPLVLLCTLVTFACRTIADVGGSPYAPMEVEPVTGLLTRDAFYEHAATMLGARNRGDDRFLVIAVITIDSYSAIASVRGTRGGTATRVAVAQALRDTVRRDAVVGHAAEAEYFIADTFTTPDPDPLVERVRGAIAGAPQGLTASLGVVSTPMAPLVGRPPFDVLDEVIALATTAMFESRGAGGNQARLVLNRRLSGGDTIEAGEH